MWEETDAPDGFTYGNMQWICGIIWFQTVQLDALYVPTSRISIITLLDKTSDSVLSYSIDFLFILWNL